MVKLVANSQLRGEYGVVARNQLFEAREEIAVHLLKSGKARAAAPPAILYQTKVITPEAPAVGARPPFRDVPMPDPQQARVATEGDSMLPGADVPPHQPSDPGGRGGRSRLAARR